MVLKLTFQNHCKLILCVHCTSIRILACMRVQVKELFLLLFLNSQAIINFYFTFIQFYIFACLDLPAWQACFHGLLERAGKN